MDSPIILLVIWFVINIIIKSVKDKQKIEQARRKRALELNDKQTNPKEVFNKDTLQRDIRKAMSTLREEIDRQRRVATPATDTYIQDKEPRISKTPKVQERKKPREEVKTQLPEIEEEIAGYSIFESKDDILKGIVLSEILSEPKSIQNLNKRSI